MVWFSSIPNSVSRTAKEEAPPDWRAAAPGLDMRALAAVALAVPLLLAAGIYWLHRLPLGPNVRTSESVIEVRLIGAQGRLAERQDNPSPVERPVQPPPDTLAPDLNQAIPAAALAMLPPQPERPAAPAATAPASAPPTSHIAIDRERAATFQRRLQSHIARFRYYPEGAKRERAQGIVALLFSMRRDGTVTDVRIVSSSGYTSLDAAAIETIRKAQPMPKIPAELPEQLTIGVPVAFDPL